MAKSGTAVQVGHETAFLENGTSATRFQCMPQFCLDDGHEEVIGKAEPGSPMGELMRRYWQPV